MENNNGNNASHFNINIINNNYYADEYHNDNNYNHEPQPQPQPQPQPENEPMNNDEILPIAMRSNMLRMLHELRVPLYALGPLRGGAAGAHVDDMEQAAVAVLARSLYDARPIKHVIDIADGETGEKHGIHELTYDPETAEELKINTACGIWQEEFEVGETIKVLPCNHAFRAEAITKWLTTEKAECPMCRFKMKSKEIIVHPSIEGTGAGAGEGTQYHYHDDDSDTDNDDDGNGIIEPDPQPQPPVDEQRARENNIMYRQNNIIYNRPHGGGIADMGRDMYYGMSMPMNQLLQMRGRLVHGGRALGAESGGGVVASIPPSQPSQLPNIITNINYYINQINQYQISAEEQEEADIEEAIRRSLE
jgi:hypothetical protein